MNIHSRVDPKYWKLLKDREIYTDVKTLFNRGKSKQVVEQYLDNLNFF